MKHLLNSALAVGLGFAVLGSPVMAAGTSDGSSTAAAPAAVTYDQAKAMVDAGNYAAALPMLVALTTADAKNADAWNLLGFTDRNLGKMDDSSKAYLVVLKLNPNHLGALEYQGELFIQTGHLDKAKANLAKLQGLCGNCEQYGDLSKALMAAGA